MGPVDGEARPTSARRPPMVGAPFADAGDEEGAGKDLQDALGLSAALVHRAFAVGAPTENAGYLLLVR